MPLPMTPQEVLDAQRASIPEFVFDAINTLLVENMSPSSLYVTLRADEISAAIREHPAYKSLPSRPDIYAKHWMDFEHHYKKAGWEVEYDQPGYNESYPATYTFKGGQNARG